MKLLAKDNELELYLQACLKKKGSLFIPYLALGDPDWQTSLELARRLLNLGADSIEFGLPFTDPVADGPVLQRTFQRILQSGFSMSKVYSIITELQKEFPEKRFIVMGYANIFYAHGFNKILKELYKRNVRGLIIPDLPFEEKQLLIQKENLQDFQSKIVIIDFITPITSDSRLQQIVQKAQGFVYVVSFKGITGQSGFTLKPLKSLFRKIKKLTDTPVMVGFGIRERSHVQETLKYADGFIIGTLIHSIIEKNLSAKRNLPIVLEKSINELLQ